MNKKCEELINKGNYCLDNNYLNDALYYFEKITKWHPKCEVIEQIYKVQMFTHERLNNLEKARALANKYKKINDPGLQRVRAIILKRCGENDDALNLSLRLLERSDLDNKSNQELHFLIADIYHNKGQNDHALKYYSKANDIIRNSPENQDKDKYYPLSFIELMENNFEDINYATPLLDTYSPTFLVGFPRSGTTLLRAILDSQSQISCIDEKETLPVNHRAILNDKDNAIDHFTDLSGTEFNEYRSIYWNEAYKYVNSENDLVIDKFPLRFIDVGIVNKIFPNAKYIFAVRHPLDCILSCFMQNFAINDSMANFYTLDEASHFYNKALSLWREYTNGLDLNVYYIYYENLVRDFETEVRKLNDFIGVTTEESMLNYYENPSHAITPSYSQIIKKPYTSSLYRYKNYEEYLKNVKEKVRNHIEWFGYDI